MRNMPVHWSEGMFLRPQHFQAADRYWQEQMTTSQNWDHPYHYGIRAIEFSREALENHQFEIHLLHARLKDGTLISLEAGQEPDRVELKDSLLRGEPVKVDLEAGFADQKMIRLYLGVPKLRLGSPNVALNGDARHERFSETEREVQDESQGGNDQLINFKDLQVRILLSTEDTTGYEILPIAQIERASEGESVPRLDVKYIPPMLAADAWPPLGRDIVRAIYDIIGKKIEVLSQQVINRGMTLYSQEPGDFDRILMLTQLNQAYSVLSVLAFAPGVHPFWVYEELCRIVGQLSIFGDERRTPDLPRYDHDDLASVFLLVKALIEKLIGSVQDYEFEQRYFVGVGLGMQVKLESKWFNSDWEWYVGVHSGELSEQECRQLLSPGHLDWKLGSSRQVEILFAHRAEGLMLMPLDHAPRALPRSADWIYFKVSRGNAVWNDVQETETLAMRLRDSLITNRNDLQGKRNMKVVFGNREAVLQFALFAVPVRR
ncbi:Type VI secretion system baseplate subunit TssK [Planctomycetales bacterium 10988]|nr:Type VI secretion system baseplate subunit TssK [Planctomycetales bacterium 10988]